ncbi:MAG: hypothetical protein WC997_02390 [Porticoccaceae bacterium]
MPGDIQLTSAATIHHHRQTPYDKQANGVVFGEEPEAAGTPGELEDTALPREQVEGFLLELQTQPAWRREADKCCDYYDNNQLSPDVVETLKDRKQPPLISNLIKPTIDTVLGMEAKSRTDWRVRPEDDEQCDDDLAEALSVKLKHAEIESRADRAVSDAYAALCKAGLGWVEVARETDPFKSPYRVNYIHRREIFWDWRSTKPDLSDARYLVRRRWLEVSEAIAMMPRYAQLFRNTVNGWSGFDPLTEPDTGLVQSWEVERDTRLSSDAWRDIHIEHVCLYEIWYRKWVRGFVMTLPNGTVMEVDFNNPRHNQAIVLGIAQVSEATFQKVRLAWYCGPHFLYDIPSPYIHKNFPYIPFFGYREDMTGVPYGMVRSMISPQDEVNARKSKMLWSLNSRRVIADSDVVLDHNRAAEEVARSDAYVILDKNRNPNSKFSVESGGDLAAQQFQAMQESKQEIAEVSGIHKAMMGQNSNASSGLAINSLAEQGLNSLAEINDNYAIARRLVGEQLFSLVKQNLLKGPSKVTIGEGKQKKVIHFNQPAIDEETGRQIIINDVAKVRAKIVLDDVPSTPTYKMQQFQMLTEITKSLPPQMQAAVVDFVIEGTDMPNRHKMAERLRAVIGVQDDEAMEAQQQAQALAQQEAKAKEDAMFELTLREKEAEIREREADIDKTRADTARINATPIPKLPSMAGA